jgi:hypothetical protein
MDLDSELRVDETPAETVVTTVAEATGRSPLEMSPLGQTVDADTLNALFDGPEERASSISVTFDYCGQRVTVTSEGVRVSSSNSSVR